MQNLSYVLKYLYPEAANRIDYQLRDEGKGPYIFFWDKGKLGEQPSEELILNSEQAALAYCGQLKVIKEAEATVTPAILRNAILGDPESINTLQNAQDKIDIATQIIEGAASDSIP